MSVLNQSGEEQVECPLCMEPLEVDDLNFYPCTCGYQICRFCWHRIRTDENGLCPACRKAYSENPADFTPLSQEQVAQLKQEKRQRDQQRKAKLTESRKHLASVRVVQRNLVFVVGLPLRLADAEMLKKHEYFGKFGKIHKVVINQSTAYAGSQGPSASAYVTYLKSDDALRAIQSVNNITLDGRLVKSSLGTTKYCSHFMKNQPCPKSDCMYLHDYGDPEASFTKEHMQAGKHQEYEKKLHDQLLAKMALASNTIPTTNPTPNNSASPPQQPSPPATIPLPLPTPPSPSSTPPHSDDVDKQSPITNGHSTTQTNGKTTTATKQDNNWPQLQTGDNTTNGKTKDKTTTTAAKSNNKVKTKQRNHSNGDKEQQTSNNTLLSQQSCSNNSLSQPCSNNALLSQHSPPIETDPEELYTTSQSPPLLQPQQLLTTTTNSNPLSNNSSKLFHSDDNSSFFSTQNSFQKFDLLQQSQHLQQLHLQQQQQQQQQQAVLQQQMHLQQQLSDESCLLGGDNLLGEGILMPPPVLEDCWEAAFGFSKHSNHLEELAQLRKDPPISQNSILLPNSSGFTNTNSSGNYEQLQQQQQQQQQQQNSVQYNNFGLTDFYKNSLLNNRLMPQQNNGLYPSATSSSQPQLALNQNNSPSVNEKQLLFLQAQHRKIEEQLMSLTLKSQQQQQQQQSFNSRVVVPQQQQQQSHLFMNGLSYLQQQQQQQLGDLSLGQQNGYLSNGLYGGENNGKQRPLAEDELDFDPYQESQKGLAEFMENEQTLKMHTGNTNRTNVSGLNGLLHGGQNGVNSGNTVNNIPPPPPGFVQTTTHMNSFGSKILPFLNMNSQQLNNSTQNNWSNNYNQLHQQPPQHKGLGVCSDWKVLDPAILSSSRHLPPFSQLRNTSTPSDTNLTSPSSSSSNPPPPHSPLLRNTHQQQLFYDKLTNTSPYTPQNNNSNSNSSSFHLQQQQQQQQQQHYLQQQQQQNSHLVAANSELNTTSNHPSGVTSPSNNYSWLTAELNKQISSPPGFRPAAPSTKQQEC